MTSAQRHHHDTARPVLARWPDEGDRRRAADEAGRPCLLVIPRGEVPPETGPLEDWIVETADERDVDARLATLIDRASERCTTGVPHGSPAERAAHLLIRRPDALIPLDELGGPAGAEAAHRLVEAIRPRLRADGWRLHRIGQVGYLATAIEAPR